MLLIRSSNRRDLSSSLLRAIIARVVEKVELNQILGCFCDFFEDVGEQFLVVGQPALHQVDGGRWIAPRASAVAESGDVMRDDGSATEVVVGEDENCCC